MCFDSPFGLHILKQSFGRAQGGTSGGSASPEAGSRCCALQAPWAEQPASAERGWPGDGPMTCVTREDHKVPVYLMEVLQDELQRYL